MACEEYQVELSALIDGELTADEQARLAAHLQICSGCRELLREFQDTSSLVRELAVPRAPAFVTDAAMRLVRAMPRQAGEPWTLRLRSFLFEPFWPKLGIEAVGLAAAVALAVFVGHGELARNASDNRTIAGSETTGSAGETPVSEGYRLSSVPADPAAAAAAAAGYDFRDPQTHGRRDISTFSARERFAWEHGAWRHARRFGRDGWWWEVSGAWYWYERPTDGPPHYASEVRFASAPPAMETNKGE